jgi:hypothetical protein
MGRKRKKSSTNNLKNNAICSLRTSVWRPDDSPQRVKNPGEPRAFDGVGRLGASGLYYLHILSGNGELLYSNRIIIIH